MPTDTAPEPWRDPNPRPDVRRLDDFVTAERATLPSADEDRELVRRRGEPMPPSLPTPEYRAWLERRAT
jgi:hypothetical protein